jgi:hypothetical protein
VTLAILQAQRRPTVWVGDPWQSIYTPDRPTGAGAFPTGCTAELI